MIMEKVICPKCDATLEIHEIPDLFPADREWEIAKCPVCNHVLREKKTSGSFTVNVIK